MKVADGTDQHKVLHSLEIALRHDVVKRRRRILRARLLLAWRHPPGFSFETHQGSWLEET